MTNNVQGERGGGNIKKGSVLTNLPNPTNMSLFLGLLKFKTSEDAFYFTFEAPYYGGDFLNNKLRMFKNVPPPDNLNINYN